MNYKNINLDKFLEERTCYPLILYSNDGNLKIEDSWLEDIISDKKHKERYYILCSSYESLFIETIQKTDWNIDTVCQLGYPLYVIYSIVNKDGVAQYASNFGESWILIHLTKGKVENVKVSLYTDYDQDYYCSTFYDWNQLWNKYKIDREFVPERIKEAHKENGIKMYPVKIDRYEYHGIDEKEILANSFFPEYIRCLSRYYAPVIDFLGLPKPGEIFKPLEKIATFIQPEDIKPNDLYLSGFKVEFDYEYDEDIHFDTSTYLITEEDIKKKRSFLVRDGDAIIRTKPEYVSYLRAYLQKNNPIIIDFFEYGHDCFGSDSKLRNIPVFIPNCDLSEFSSTINFMDSHGMVKLKKIKIENNFAKESINADMQELRKCFEVGAYKAVLIMAGSILEAFLIDWLSDEDKTNYFEKDGKFWIKNWAGVEKTQKAETLDDYIRAIQYRYRPGIKDPPWKGEYANYIREKRNLVHAKLYYNHKDVNPINCQKVLDYLEYMFDYRWNSKKK